MVQNESRALAGLAVRLSARRWSRCGYAVVCIAQMEQLEPHVERLGEQSLACRPTCESLSPHRYSFYETPIQTVADIDRLCQMPEHAQVVV